MIERINIESFLERSKKIPVIDVRSPSEFKQGHIPAAFSLPLFTDDERSIIGTLYSHSGREASVMRGLELAGPKLSLFVKNLHKITSSKEILVHCWRGGMRSENMGWLFSQAGYHVYILEGGYKSFRRFIRRSFSDNRMLFILGGLTGSGKTEILRTLADSGEQVLDLENLAHHKGSVFGSLGQPEQPTNEQFENDIYDRWGNFDPTRIIWMEDESRMIGSVSIPDPLFEQMNKAILIRLDVAKENRIRNLLKEYGSFSPEVLKTSILKIAEKLGGTNTKIALEALDRKDLATISDIVLEYYDKSYEHAVVKRAGKKLYSIAISDEDPVQNANKILQITNGIRLF